MNRNLNILVINGPNINMLGVREPEQYGSKSYKDLEMELHEYSFEMGVNLEIFQSNFEGEIIEKIAALESRGAKVISKIRIGDL